MAEAHVYVRVQVSGSNADVTAVEKAVAAVKSAVTEAGGEWRGDVKVQLDDVPTPETVPDPPVKARRFGK